MKQTLSKSTTKIVENYFTRPPHNKLKLNQFHNQKVLQSTNYFIPKRNNSIYCWKCGVPRRNTAELFCEKCNIIQSPLEKENYFKVFDIEEKFSIDQQSLRTKFRRLQSLLHPDKFSRKTDEEQTISEEYSSLLNKAYSSLQVPLKRAEHLLNLKGEQIGEGHSVDDPMFLMDMMTLNEEVENAEDNISKLKELNAKNKAELDKIAKEIDACFRNNDVQKAKANIVKLKYFTSISSRINNILRELGDSD